LLADDPLPVGILEEEGQTPRNAGSEKKPQGSSCQTAFYAPFSTNKLKFGSLGSRKLLCGLVCSLAPNCEKPGTSVRYFTEMPLVHSVMGINEHSVFRFENFGLAETKLHSQKRRLFGPANLSQEALIGPETCVCIFVLVPQGSKANKHDYLQKCTCVENLNLHRYKTTIDKKWHPNIFGLFQSRRIESTF